MVEPTPASASAWYLGALIGGFAGVALWETWRPLRPPLQSTARRWAENIALMAINQALVPWLLPLLTLAAAWQARAWHIGLLPWSGLPGWAQALLGVLALDALRWALHRALHQLPWLWRLHRVHHSDRDYDCTIGLRFHPLEALASQAVLVLGVLLLGVPPLAVLVSDVLTLAHGYVAHGNVSLPPRCDRRLRWVVVTPDLHRVHHSARLDESQSNFGSVLTLWDRLAGSLREAPVDGALGMQIGLAEQREAQPLGLWRLLAMPFRRLP